MVELRRKGHTKVFTDKGITTVQLYATPVVQFGRGIATLRTGGYQTTTTKQRIMQASRDFGLGYDVFQRKFQLYVKGKSGKVRPFHEGIRVRY